MSKKEDRIKRAREKAITIGPNGVADSLDTVDAIYAYWLDVTLDLEVAATLTLATIRELARK